MIRRILFLVITLAVLAACQSSAPAATPGRKNIVVTYSVLGAVIKDLVGDRANVIVPMPNGQDPHDWEPSAKDIETIMKADLVVQNGLGLEGGLEKTLEQAKQAGVKFFTASDHIIIRQVGQDEGLPTGDPDQAAGAEDPHLWMDPIMIKMVVEALAPQLKTDLGIDVSDRASDLAARLDRLDQQVKDMVDGLPEANRKLVTGHESMGYFAQRYGFKLVGAIIPSLTSQAEVSASDLAGLKKLIQDNGVKAIFAELGAPQAVAAAIGSETGVKVVQLSTHSLPDDGSYFTFMRNLATTLTDALK